MSGTLLKGKKGLVMGVANKSSIAWGIAEAAAEQGAELAFSYLSPTQLKRLAPLAEQLGSPLLLPCDVAEKENVDALFKTIKETWGTIDFVVHSLAFSNKDELKGRYRDTTRENFLNSLLISTFSLTEVCQGIKKYDLMPQGGSVLTLSYLGAQRTLPSYNVMGVAKAALESSVRYLAADLGPEGVRVNALSSGPMRTLSGAVIGDSREIFKKSADLAPLGRNPELHEVGNAGVYLLSSLSRGVTGEVHFVDGGANTAALSQDLLG